MDRARGAIQLESPDVISESQVFFQNALETYYEAAGVASSPIRQTFDIAENPVRLEFAGPALRDHITPALEHLAVESANEPRLTVHIWDGVTTGMRIPQLPWDGAMVTRRGDIRGFGGHAIRVALDRSADTLAAFDSECGIGLYCTRDASRLPPFETAAPLRRILTWSLWSFGLYFVHSAAIGTRDRAVLLAGKGGSGKTTTALACLNSDLYYLGDDYCAVSPSELRVFNLYNTAKVSPDSLGRLAFLQKMVSHNPIQVGDKTVLFLNRHAPNKILHSLPLKAILLPRVTGRSTSQLAPASPGAALGALALSTMVQLPGTGAETLQALRELTRRLPCYTLELGTAIGEIPKLIASLLQD